MKSQLGQRVVGSGFLRLGRGTHHETVLCGTARARSAASRRGILQRRHLSSLPTPFGRPAAPARLSRALYAAATPPPRVAADSVEAPIRDRATVLTLTITITKKRGNASGKMTRRRPKELLWSEGVKRADTSSPRLLFKLG